MFMSQNTIRFAEVIGSGALRFWPDLPREIQKRLFEKAVLKRRFGPLYLRDHRPRTAHPPRPLAPTP
jgi:hypothetical protein